MSEKNKSNIFIKDKTIVIEFDKILKRDLSKFNNIEITKRSYHTILPFIRDEISFIVEEKGFIDYIYSLLEFMYELNAEEDHGEGYYLEIIDKGIFESDELKEIVFKKVYDNYTINIDTNEYKNERLQLTDDMNKRYLVASIYMRLLVPFIQVYRDKFKLSDKERDKITFKLYANCMIFANDGDKDILERLHNIVSSRIASTRYSNIVIWDFLEKMNRDITLTIKSNYEYIIVNNFVKIENNKSVISYIDVVIRNRLRNLFGANYKYAYKNVSNQSDSPSDELTDMEKLESSILRRDRGINIINELSVKQEVENIKKQLLLGELDSSEFDDFMENYHFNMFTSKYLDIFYKRKFNVVYKEEYVIYLVFKMISDMYSKRFTTLPKLLVSNITAIKINNKRKIVEKIRSSNKYMIVRKKYDNISNILDDKEHNNNFVDNMIFDIKSKQFIDPITEDEINVDIDVVTEEILDFLSTY